MTEYYRAPVEGGQDNLTICQDYFGKLIDKAYRQGKLDLLNKIGVCYHCENDTYYLAVNLETGETGAEAANCTDTNYFTAYLNTLKGFDPDVTPAQAATSLVAQPIFDFIKDRFPPEFNQLKILSFPRPGLNLAQTIRSSL
ncbi:MAG: hypothetical protein NTZ93_00260 [Candidatus Beckwithbacteria bacterium]|nr:hypothetical protein [Candidatus Beckwithbacteria bacterium]